MSSVIRLECEDAVRMFCHGMNDRAGRRYVTFATPALRNLFLSICNRPMININASEGRFVRDMEYFNEETIFTGLKNCDNLNILYIVRETNNIMI